MTYKIEWEAELDRRARLGITNLPDPLPHPDHVVINIRRGTARIVGPATKEEKAEWDMWIARKADFELEIIEQQEMVKTETDPRMRTFLESDIAQSRKVVDIIERGLAGKPLRK